MFSSSVLAQLKLNRPATYRITVCGCLDTSWSEDLACVGIAPIALEHEVVVTVLTGTFRDQAELFGVLNRLYNLGFLLYQVECLALAPGGE